MKKPISGFGRKGPKPGYGTEIVNPGEWAKAHTRGIDTSVLRQVFTGNLFVYGSVAPKIRRFGFPGTSLNDGLQRFGSPQTWDVFPYDLSRPKLLNEATLVRTRKDGTVTSETRTLAVLRTAIAQEFALVPSKGVIKSFRFPDSKIADFKWLMPSNYLRSEGYMSITPGTATFTGSNASSSWVQTVNGYSTFTSLSSMADSALLRKYWSLSGSAHFAGMHTARQRCISKIRRNDIELSVALAESRKTITHLAKTAVDIFKLYRAIKSGDLKAVRRILKIPKNAKGNSKLVKAFNASKVPAQRWLEMRYAWQPLLGDVNGAITTILKPSRQQMTFRATGNYAEDINYTVDQNSTNPIRHEIHVATGRRISKCIVHYAVTDPAAVLIAEMGINPLLAIWEVVPWSFVIDWFTNIGDFLETIDVGIGKEFISGTETQYNRLYRVSKLPIQRLSFPVSPMNPQGGHSSAESHFMCVKRTTLSTWPKIGAYIKNPLSTNHVLDAIALSRSMKK